MDCNLDEMEKFCHAMPKVELHAHINGSCGAPTLEKLLKLKKARDPTFQPSAEICLGTTGTLDECFERFKLIHELNDSNEAAYVATCDVVREFAADNVQYLELRTTPRDVAATRMSKASYVDCVLKAIHDTTAADNTNIEVRLMLAIDRKMSVNDIEEVLKLAEYLSAQTGSTVVGMDLSGDPNVGNIISIMQILEQAKQKGLKLSLHIAETAASMSEAGALLSMADRIGHGTFLLPGLAGSSEFAEKVIANRIPLELCFSSNVQTKTVPNFDSHHFDFWYKKGHPCIICTDDKGVFATDLSTEYVIAARTFGLTRKQLWHMSYDSIDCIFGGEVTKNKLRQSWNKLKHSVLGENSSELSA